MLFVLGLAHSEQSSRGRKMKAGKIIICIAAVALLYALNIGFAFVSPCVVLRLLMPYRTEREQKDSKLVQLDAERI